MRKCADCRDIPSDNNCSVRISADTEEECVEAAVHHAVQVHSHEDSEELRNVIREGLKNVED